MPSCVTSACPFHHKIERLTLAADALKLRNRIAGNLLLGLVAIGIFTNRAEAAKTCKDLFAQAKSNPISFSRVVENPEDFVGRQLDEPEIRRQHGTPFRVVRLSELKPLLQEALEDIHVLSLNEGARENLFGSAKKNGELASGVLKKPIGLKMKTHDQTGFFVEVGVDVITLNTGEHLFLYRTSNSGNSIESPYGFWSDLVSTLKAEGKSITALDSFHTHPRNLLPSINDRDHFNTELTQVKKDHPELDLTNWKMRTTMDDQIHLHELSARDHLK